MNINGIIIPPLPSVLLSLYIIAIVIHSEFNIQHQTLETISLVRIVGYPIFITALYLICIISTKDHLTNDLDTYEKELALLQTSSSQYEKQSYDENKHENDQNDDNVPLLHTQKSSTGSNTNNDNPTISATLSQLSSSSPIDQIVTCKVCHKVRPSTCGKVHHCRICRKCVVFFDHHCGFLGVCISKKYILKFILLLTMGVAGHLVVYTCISLNNRKSIIVSLKLILQHVFNDWGDISLMFSSIYHEILDTIFLWFYGLMSTLLTMFLGYNVLNNWKAVVSYFNCFSRFQQHCYQSSSSSSSSSSSYTTSGNSHEVCANFMTRMHMFANLTHPMGFRGAFVTPIFRWKMNCVLTVPYFIYTYFSLFYDDADGDSGKHSSYYWDYKRVMVMIGVMLLIPGIHFMRVCILTHNSNNNNNASTAVSSNSSNSTGCNASNSINSRTSSDIEENNAHYKNHDVENAQYRCQICRKNWSLQDHHCGGFGTCIHKHNRTVYTRFLLLASYSSFMFALAAYTDLQRVWIFPSIWLFITGILSEGNQFDDWKAQFYALLLPSIWLYITLAFAFFFLMCALQQYTYIFYEAKFRYTYLNTVSTSNSQNINNSNTAAANTATNVTEKLKSDWRKVIVTIAYTAVDVRRFETDIINDIMMLQQQQ